MPRSFDKFFSTDTLWIYHWCLYLTWRILWSIFFIKSKIKSIGLRKILKGFINISQLCNIFSIWIDSLDIYIWHKFFKLWSKVGRKSKNFSKKWYRNCSDFSRGTTFLKDSQNISPHSGKVVNQQTRLKIVDFFAFKHFIKSCIISHFDGFFNSQSNLNLRWIQKRMIKAISIESDPQFLI